MKILITGAKGQLGRDCAQVLGAAHAVSAFGSRELDIGDRAAVTDLMRSGFDLVLNCAAYTAVDGCETDREQCWRVNADGPGILAAACARQGSRLIHISTDYVFDGAKPPPQAYTEEDPVGPLSQYGLSKLEGEQRIRERTPDHLIIRTAWLYGIGGRNFLKTMLRLAVGDPKRPIRVVNDQFGSLTWTRRLAGQIRVLVDSGLTGTIHATAEGRGSWYEGARLFLEAMGVAFTIEPCTTADYPTPTRRPVNSILENGVLKKKGLNRMVPWEEDVLEFARVHREELLAEARG
ncbi:MAG TPA: dTDP-4-dehydrorhamnose reductase [Desulfobacteraceae bacterium]|nr:dTDP-4-dehydrorhamnose reductase [Desulfobacteraceae bacterium]